MPTSTRLLRMGLLAWLLGCGDRRVKDFEPVDGRPAYRGVPIADGDPRTFEALSDHYARDARHVWYCDTYRKGQEHYLVKHPRVVEIAGADPASFRYVDQGYATDAARVYHDGAPLTTEVASFRLLPHSYAVTATRVFHHGKPVPGADAATFRVLDAPSDSADAQDRHGAFQQGRRVGDVSPAAR